MQTVHLTRSTPMSTMMSSSVRPLPADVPTVCCSCCPYGYHIDVDFLGFLDSLKNGGDLRRLKKIQSQRRKQRQLIETRMLIEGQQLNVDGDEYRSSSDFGSGPITPVSQSSEDEREEEGSTSKMLEEIDASIADALTSIDVLMHSRRRPPVNVSSYDNVSSQSTTNGDISQYISTSIGKNAASVNVSAALPSREISPALSISGSSSSSQERSNSVSPAAGVTYVEPYQQARVAVTVRNTEAGRRSSDALEKRSVTKLKSPPPIPPVRSSSTKYGALQAMEREHNAEFIDPEFPISPPVLTSVSHHAKHNHQTEKHQDKHQQRTGAVNSRSPEEVPNLSSLSSPHSAHKVHGKLPVEPGPGSVLPQTSAVISSSCAPEICQRIPEKRLSDSGSEVENEVKVTAAFSSPTGRITKDSRGQEMLMRILVEKSQKSESHFETSLVTAVTKPTTVHSVNDQKIISKQVTPSSDFGRSFHTPIHNTQNSFQPISETSKPESGGAVVKEKPISVLEDVVPTTMVRRIPERSFSDSGVDQESADSSIGDQPTSPVDGSKKSEDFSMQRQRPSSDSDAAGSTNLPSNQNVAVSRSLPARPSSASEVETSVKTSSVVSIAGRGASGGLRVIEQETFQQRLQKSPTDSPFGRASPKSSSFSSVRALQSRKQPSRRVVEVAALTQSAAVSVQPNDSEKLDNIQQQSTIKFEAGSRQPMGSGLQDGSQTQVVKFMANAQVLSQPQGGLQLQDGPQVQTAARLPTAPAVTGYQNLASAAVVVTTASSAMSSTDHGPTLRHFSPTPFQRKESLKESSPSLEPQSLKDKTQTEHVTSKSVSETDVSVKPILPSQVAITHSSSAEAVSPIEDLIISDSSVMPSKSAQVQLKSAANIPYQVQTVSLPQIAENRSQSATLEATPTDSKSKNAELSQKKRKEKGSDETLEPCNETSSEQLAKAMAFLMTDSDYGTASPGSPAMGRVDPDVLMSIRQCIASSLQQMRLLEQEAKTIPVLQLRISVLKEEKRMMRMQLASLKKDGNADVPTTEKYDGTVDVKTSTFEENEPRNQLGELKKIEQCSVAVGDRKTYDKLDNQPLCKNCRLAISDQDIVLTGTPIQCLETGKLVVSQSTEPGTIWTPQGKSSADDIKSPSEEGILYPQPSSPPRGRACRVIVEDGDQTFLESDGGKGSSYPPRRQPPPVARKEISIRKETGEDRCSVGIQCTIFQSDISPVSPSPAPVFHSKSGPVDGNYFSPDYQQTVDQRSQEPGVVVTHCPEESFPLEPNQAQLHSSHKTSVDAETALLTAKIQTSSACINTDLCGIDNVVTFSMPGTGEHFAKSNDFVASSDVSQSTTSLITGKNPAASNKTVHHMTVSDCSINTDISGEILSARSGSSELQPISNKQISATVPLWQQPIVATSLHVPHLAREAISSQMLSLLSPKPIMIDASCSADIKLTHQFTDETMTRSEAVVKTKPEMIDAGCSTDLLVLPTAELSDVVDANLQVIRATPVPLKTSVNCDAAVNTTDHWNFVEHGAATGKTDHVEKHPVTLLESDILAAKQPKHEVSRRSELGSTSSDNESVCVMCKHAIMKRSVTGVGCDTETVTAAELPTTAESTYSLQTPGMQWSLEAMKRVTVSESTAKYSLCDASCNTDSVVVLSVADGDVSASSRFARVSTCDKSCSTDAAFSLPSPPAAAKKKPPVKLPTKDFGCTAKLEVAEVSAENKSLPKLQMKNVECSADIRSVSHDVACYTDKTENFCEIGCNTDEAVKASSRDAASTADIPRKTSTCTVAINTTDILKPLVVDVGCGTKNISRQEMCEICCGPDDPFDILQLQELTLAAGRSFQGKATLEVACNTDSVVKLAMLDQSSATDKPSRADSHTTMHSCSDTSTVASNTDAASVKSQTTETQNSCLTTTEVGSNTNARPSVHETASLTDVLKLSTSEVGCCTESVSKPIVKHASSTADICVKRPTREAACGVNVAFYSCDVSSATDAVVLCESGCNTDAVAEAGPSKGSVPVSSTDVGCNTDIIRRPSVAEAGTSTDVTSTSNAACVTDDVNFVESSTKDATKLISTADVACETDLTSFETSAVLPNATPVKASYCPITCEAACNTEVLALELNSPENLAVCDIGCMSTHLKSSTSDAACSVDIVIKPSMRDVSCDAIIAAEVLTSDAAVTATVSLQEFGCNTDTIDKQVNSLGCMVKPSMADVCCTTELTVTKDADSMTELLMKPTAVDVSSNTDEISKPATREVSCSAELKLSVPSAAIGCNTDPVTMPATDTVASNTDPQPHVITHAVACNTDEILKPSTKTVGCSVEQKVLIPTIELGCNTDKPDISENASNTDPLPETQVAACNTDETSKPTTRTVGLLTEVKVLTPTGEFGCNVDLITKPSTCTVALNTDPLKDADIMRPLTWEVACNTDLPRETASASNSETELKSPSLANSDIKSSSLDSEHVCCQPPKPVMVEVACNTDLCGEPGTPVEWISVTGKKELLVDLGLKTVGKVLSVDVACNTDLLRDSGTLPPQKKETKEIGCIASPTTRESSSLTDAVDGSGHGVATSPATTPVKSSGKLSSNDKTKRRIFTFEPSATVEEKSNSVKNKTPDKLPSTDLDQLQAQTGTADVACGTDIELHSKLFSMGFDQDQLATMLAALDNTDERSVAIRRRFYPTQDAACNTDHDLKQVTPTRQLGKPAWTPFSPTTDDVMGRSEAVSMTPHDDIIVGPSEILRDSASKIKKETQQPSGRTVDQSVNTVSVTMLSKAANTTKLSTATRATSTDKPTFRHKAIDAIVIQVDKGVGDGDVKQKDAVSNYSLMSPDSLESNDDAESSLSAACLSVEASISSASLPSDGTTVDQSAISEDINNNSDEIILLPAAETSPLSSPKFDECRFIDDDVSDNEDLMPTVNASGLGRRWGTVDLMPEESLISPCGSLPIIVCSDTPTTLKSIMKPRGSASSDQSRLNRKAISFSQDVIFRERELEKSDDDVDDEGEMTVFENISLDKDVSTESIKSEPSTVPQTSMPTIVIELSADLAAASDMYALWLQDSTEVTSKQLNHSLKVIRHEWFTMTSQKSTDVLRIGQFLADMKSKSPDLLKNVVNMADDNGNSALHYAMSNSQFDVVRLLLETAVCDVSRQNKTGCTVIMLASLVRVETDEDRLVIQQLLKLGDINQQASLAGQTALMLAASRERGDIVRMLLDAGADVNIQDDDGSTALMCAAEHGYIEVVKMLLAHPDCDPSLEDNEGSTALSVALEAGHRDIGVLLYAHANQKKSASGKQRFGKRKSPSPKPFKTN